MGEKLPHVLQLVPIEDLDMVMSVLEEGIPYEDEDSTDDDSDLDEEDMEAKARTKGYNAALDEFYHYFETTWVGPKTSTRGVDAGSRGILQRSGLSGTQLSRGKSGPLTFQRASTPSTSCLQFQGHPSGGCCRCSGMRRPLPVLRWLTSGVESMLIRTLAGQGREKRLRRGLGIWSRAIQQ